MARLPVYSLLSVPGNTRYSNSNPGADQEADDDVPAFHAELSGCLVDIYRFFVKIGRCRESDISWPGGKNRLVMAFVPQVGGYSELASKLLQRLPFPKTHFIAPRQILAATGSDQREPEHSVASNANDIGNTRPHDLPSTTGISNIQLIPGSNAIDWSPFGHRDRLYGRRLTHLRGDKPRPIPEHINPALEPDELPLADCGTGSSGAIITVNAKRGTLRQIDLHTGVVMESDAVSHFRGWLHEITSLRAIPVRLVGWEDAVIGFVFPEDERYTYAKKTLEFWGWPGREFDAEAWWRATPVLIATWDQWAAKEKRRKRAELNGQHP